MSLTTGLCCYLAAVACSIYVKVCWLLFPAQIARLLLGKAGNQLSQRFHLDNCDNRQDFTMSGEGPTDIRAFFFLKAATNAFKIKNL